MRLRSGVTVATAIDVIERIISASQSPRTILPTEAIAKVNSYVGWVDTSQKLLRSAFSDYDIEDALLDRGYWHIATMPYPLKPSEMRLINEELEYQAGNVGIPGDHGGRLGDVLTRLRSLAQLAEGAGDIYVPDTNALLHYTRFDQLDWPARTGSEKVRLVIPLVVIDEVDAKKYARRAEFFDRARSILTVIDQLMSGAGTSSVNLRKGVTVEVLPDEDGHIRLPSNDQEILDRCQFLNQATGKPVTLITGDSGARINARSREIEVFKLSEDDLLPRYKVGEDSTD